MQSIRKEIFLSNGISKDLINLLNSYGFTQVKKVFENSKNKEALKNLMKEILTYEFIDLPKKEFKFTNEISYQSLEKVLKQLKYFTIDSNYYKDLQTKHKKLSILLDSIPSEEAKTIVKIIQGNYDKESIKTYLQYTSSFN